jgi:hypothetical protein
MRAVSTGRLGGSSELPESFLGLRILPAFSHRVLRLSVHNRTLATVKRARGAFYTAHGH